MSWYWSLTALGCLAGLEDVRLGGDLLLCLGAHDGEAWSILAPASARIVEKPHARHHCTPVSHLQGHDVYVACKLAMAELILTGCTTTADNHYLYPNDVRLEDSIRAARCGTHSLLPARPCALQSVPALLFTLAGREPQACCLACDAWNALRTL